MSPKNEEASAGCPPVASVGSCFFCGQVTSHRCGHCSNIFTCSKEHHLIHRPGTYCYPFIVKVDPVVGRYVVAARDIAPCEPVLRELPAVTGPYTPTSPLCLACYTPVDMASDPFLCPDCNLPMCNQQCAASEVHQQECQYARRRNMKFDIANLETTKTFFSSITILRMLLAKKNNPEVYARMMNLMDHLQERQAEGQYLLNSMKVHIMSFLFTQFGSIDYSEQEIDRCIGILKVNGMKLDHGRLRQNPGVVLYPIYCLINSDCVSNTNYIKTEASLELQVRAQVAIKAGQEITTRYVSPTLGNCRRRQHLRKYWYFDCCCARCSDTTELGSHMSSLVCGGCRRGRLVKTRPLEPASDWACDAAGCGARLPTRTVEAGVDSLEEEAAQADTGDPDTLEELLWRLGGGGEGEVLLHPHHYILIEIAHSLVFAYNSHNRLTRPQMDRKIQLCYLILSVLGQVDPGFTAWRGKILNELSNTLLLVSRADHAAKIITMAQYKRRIFTCMKNVALAKKCLNLGFTETQ